jgi:hypothetical protein
MSETWSSDRRRRNYVEFGWENISVSGHLEDPANERITI